MREKDVAAYLEINPKTLYRYRKSGKLAFRAVAGKTRPLIEYDPADVEALKAELERQRSRSPKPVKAAGVQPRRVSFGLPPEGYRELEAEADKYGLGVGEYARCLVREGLESRFQAEAAELRGEVKRLQAEILKVRHEFAGGFEAVLEYTGMAPEDARQWVTDNLR
jgi:hypothetical protein